MMQTLEFLGIGLLMLTGLIFLRESGTRMGPVSIFTGAILGATFYTFDWSFWVGIPAGLLWLLIIQSTERSALQKNQEERAKTIHDAVLKGEDTSRFALYLRSFDAQALLNTQGTQSINHKHNFEEVLAMAIERDGWSLVAAGKRGEEVGAARIELIEKEWQQDVASLIHKAAIIFLLPNEKRGTWWEIEFIIKNSYLFKTVFIMPESILTYNRPGGGAISISLDELERGIPEDWEKAGHSRPHKRLWEATRKAMARSFKVELPKYNSDGALIILGRNSEVSCVKKLNMQSSFLRIRNLRRAVNEMITHIDSQVNTQ